MSKVILDCFGFVLLRSVIGPENSRDPLNLLNPKSDQHLISPYHITPESHMKVTRIKKMITNKKKLLISKQILLVSTSGNV